jgi:hypothetical protein
MGRKNTLFAEVLKWDSETCISRDRQSPDCIGYFFTGP